MTNEEKAKEIASKYERWNQEDDESFGAYNGAMEMAEWKDKQYAEALTPILIELDELKHQIKSLLPFKKTNITQEERDLLLKDLCERITYVVT